MAIQTPPPWAELIKQASGDIRRLSSVWRYSSIPISIPENTADHSYWVALYAAMIHQATNPNNIQLMGPIVFHALMHDLPECVTGDVVRVFKYTSNHLREEINKAEHVLANKLPSRIRKLVQFDLAWMCGDKSGKEASDRRQYIETIVKAADFLSLFQFMRREAMHNNYEIIPFYNRFLDDLKMMEKESVEIQKFDAPMFYFTLYSEADGIKNTCFPEELKNNRSDTL